MSASVDVFGRRRTVSLKPTDTNEATLVTAGKAGMTVVWICIANGENAANAASVEWYDGTTDWPVYAAKSIAANDTHMADVCIEIPDGGSLKVTSGDADEITFTVTIVESLGAVGGRQTG
jgi:hypothetical protein